MATVLIGKGYGDTHDWERLPHKKWTVWEDALSSYKCRECGRGFSHWYHETPDIFEAMKRGGVGVCPNSEFANRE